MRPHLLPYGVAETLKFVTNSMNLDTSVMSFPTKRIVCESTRATLGS